MWKPTNCICDLCKVYWKFILKDRLILHFLLQLQYISYFTVTICLTNRKYSQWKKKWKWRVPNIYIVLGGIELKNAFLSDIRHLRTVCNTMTADDKYSVRNRENLLQQMEMRWSKKQKVISQSFAAFLKTILHFEHFE